MSNESQPQEWTPQLLGEMLGVIGTKIGLEKICAAHNVALAAEREKVTIADSACKLLRGLCTILHEEIHELRQQLLQAQAGIAEHNNSLEVQAYPDFKIESVDLSALNKHDELVRRPLVHCLKGIKLALESIGGYNNTIAHINKVLNFTPSTMDVPTTGRASVNAPKTNP